MAKQRAEIVIVDDDASFREYLQGALEKAGYITSSVATAEEARLVIEARRPAAVLTDVKLAGVSGYELCREVKEMYNGDVAVVIVSGERTEPFDRAAGILLGADDYLVKPLDPGELVARVWRLTGRPTAGGRTKQFASSNDKFASLTTREREVLALLAEGESQDDIAESLYISSKTVATHIQRILTKLEVRNRTQAVALALRSERGIARGAAMTDEANRHARRRPRAGHSTRARAR